MAPPALGASSPGGCEIEQRSIDARDPEGRGRLIGRTYELGLLVEALNAARAGHGRIVLVSGEPGIGKTRLAGELASEAEALESRAYWGRCWEAGGAPVYWPWVQAIRSMLREADPERLRQHFGNGGPDVACIVPELRDLIPDLPEVPREDTDAARFRVFDATSKLLRAIAAEQAVVVILDDLHAADEPSLLLLRFVAADMWDSRLLILATYRGEELAPADPRQVLLADLARSPAAQRLDLRGLSEADVGHYIEVVGGTRPSPALAAAVHRETEGNPLFVGEVVRLLAAEGRLESFEGPADRPSVIPATVRAVIGQRLSSLSDPCRELLGRASVLGVEVRPEVLAQLGTWPSPEFRALLHEAAEARILAEPAFVGGLRRFGHAMIREVLYTALPIDTRRQLHRESGEILERLHGGDADPPLAELAHHFVEAAAGAKAVEYARKAAERATSQYAHEEAARLYGLALAAGDLPDDTRCGLLLRLGEAWARAGDLTSGRGAFLDAAKLAERLGLVDDFAWAAIGYGGRFVWLRAGDDDVLVPLLERALEALGPDVSPLRVRLLARLAGALRDEPSVERRDAVSAEALDLARQSDEPKTLVYALLARSAAIMGPDRLSEMTALAEEARRVAAITGDRELLADVHWLTFLLLLTKGGEREAICAELDFMGRLARELRQPSHFWYHAVTSTIFALLEGRLGDVEDRLPETRQRGEPFSYVSGLFLLRLEQDRLGEIADLVHEWVGAYPGYRLLTCTAAFVDARTGKMAAARATLKDLSGDGYAYLPRDGGWLFGLILLAETAILLAEWGHAQEIEALLAPYSGLVGTASGEGSGGPVDRALGLLAAAGGRLDEALARLEQAAETSRRMGATLWETRIAVERAAVLARRRQEGDDETARDVLEDAIDDCRASGLTAIQRQAERTLADLVAMAPTVATAGTPSGAEASFRREGEVWGVTYQGRTNRFRDARGLRYLAVLLANPGREFHALDLAAPRETGPDQAHVGEVAAIGLSIDRGATTGGGIDEEAKQAYRLRLRELRAELDEAENVEDGDRAERVRIEMAALTDELSRAYGLRGPRRSGSPTERARQSVTKAIHEALRRIAREDEALGDHLRRSVRTGVYCAYDPDPSAAPEWLL